MALESGSRKAGRLVQCRLMSPVPVDEVPVIAPYMTTGSRLVCKSTASLFVGILLVLLAPQSSCGQSVTYDPYAGVRWGSDLRCLAQFHDHASNLPRLQATADAGYCFASYFHYSGNPSRDYAWTEYRWPVDDWLGDGAEAGLSNLSLFPSVEQIAPSHWTSPWINGYIEYRPGGLEDNQYETPEEGFALARELGALPILAHPWGGQDNITGMHAVEIHNGYGLNKHLDGTLSEDLNDKLLPYWDRKLVENPRLFGVAVNDWFGPFSRVTAPGLAWAQDTGKQILLVPDKTSASAKEAFRNGAMFALVDKGVVKGQYADVNEIAVLSDSIRITTDGTVRWIADGEEVHVGQELPLSRVLGGYVRAEIELGPTTVYTQPWEISHPEWKCDFTGDERCGFDDADALSRVGELAQGVSSGFDPKFDLNGDERVDTSDLSVWLQQAAEANGFSSSLLLGDANLDGAVDQSDLNALGIHWLQEGAVWSKGDFNGDRRVDAADLSLVGLSWQGRVPKRRESSPVPEPSSHWMVGCLLCVVALARRHW